MYIQKIKVKYFKSFEDMELDLDSINGLWKINGVVGAGKTSIGEAIIYGLFGTVSGKSNVDLISWNRNKSVVELWCRSYNNNIYIKREINRYGQSPTRVEINGEELVASNKRDIQSRLENEYYDTPKTMIELLCIISFNNFKSLTTLNTGDTRKFLDHILGFSLLTEYNNKCLELKSLNKTNIDIEEKNYSNLEGQINKLKEISNLNKIEGDLKELQNNLKCIKSSLSSLEMDMNNELQLAKKDIDSNKKSLHSTSTLGVKLKKELEVLKKGKCPTCGSLISDNILDSKQQELNTLRESYTLLVEKDKQLLLKYENIKNEKLKDVNIYKSQINETEKVIIKLKEQEKYININLSEIDTLKLKLKDIQEKLLILKKDDEEWNQLSNIISINIRNKILSSFIPSLNENINKYSQLFRLPYIIKYDNNFKCNLVLAGTDKEIPLSSLSTGQLKTVDMTVILGVLGTIINNCGMNVLFLDELFSNLDNNLRNNMCEVLKSNCKPNQSIFIISHTELDDNYFNGEIHIKLKVKNQIEKFSEVTIKKY